MFTVATIRTHAGRTYAAIQRQPGWLTRLAAGAIVLTLVAVALIILIPVIVIILALLALNFVARTIRGLFTGATAPNGPLDGRKNVRVRTSTDP